MTLEQTTVDLISSVIATEEDPFIDLNDTTIPVIFRDNCSVYNPCGRYGYCRDNEDGEWACICKFWWNGTLCNELTNSGQQVIALGVIVFVLIAVFHGIALFDTVSKRRKLPKSAPKQKVPAINRSVSSTFATVFPPARRIVSLITGILTVILAVSTLLIKWSIIKPIHNEIVEKFKNEQPLFFQRHSICQIIDLKKDFNLFTFPVTCLLILIFIIITKRVSFLRNKYFKGYIGVPIPIDFFAHAKRTLAAVIFAICADELLDIARDTIFRSGSSSANQGIIVSYLNKVLHVIIIGLRRYPILAAVYIDNYVSLICATIYVWLDFSVTIVHSGLCLSEFYSTDGNYNKTGDEGTIRNFNYYGTGSKLIFLQLLTDIPRYSCLAYISIKLPMLLIKHIRYRKLIDRQLTREQKTLLYSSLPHSTDSRYVKRLLGMSNTETSTNRFVQIIRRIYTWRDDFRFSSRVICVYASVFLILFFFTVQTLVQALPWLGEAHDALQDLVNMLPPLGSSSNSNLQKPENPSADFPLPDFVRPYVFAVMGALVITVVQLLVMLAGIRRNLLQAFRGDDCEIPRRVFSRNVSYITGNFHFAGYLIGYVLLNYLFLIVIVLLLALAIDAFITFRSVMYLERLLKFLIPIFLFMFFKIYLNKILGKYVFLQHSGDVLSTNNRRAYMVFIYFNFFLDALLGVIAALIRILKSIIGGVLYMCRLDYSPLGRKLETMDAGFKAYCGLIHVECAHRHPVLLCFVSHLLRDHLYATTTKRLSKAKHKWYLAVFLFNNPTLIYRRKGFLSSLQEKEVRMMLLGRRNVKEIYVEQPPILAHRASMISDKELEDLWEQRRF